jgi:hydrogenase maturation protease
MTVAPLLVIGIGNPSRGDDALGPALLDALRAAGVEYSGRVELLTDFQLQVEHALDLEGRRAVLFVDASWPGASFDGSAGTVLTRIQADAAASLSSHALRPQAVLQVCAALRQPAPPAWQLAIEGRRFELGEPISELARRHLADAVEMAGDWLQAHAEAA